MRTLSILYDQLTSPSRAVVGLVEQRPYGLAILVVALAVISEVVGKTLVGPGYMLGGVSFLVLSFVAQFAFVLVSLVVATSIYHFAATNEYVTGHARVLFLLIAVCFLPYILLAPLSILAQATPQSGPIWFAGAAAIWIWVFGLKVSAVRHYYAISAGSAFFVVLLPYLIIVGLALIAMMFFFSSIAAALQDFAV